MIETTVCIIGAGPAGAATALQLHQYGISCVVVDKAVFPRDKVCGDGLSGKTLAALNRIDKNIGERLSAFALKEDSWGALLLLLTVLFWIWVINLIMIKTKKQPLPVLYVNALILIIFWLKK
ncbi:NAD(P)/FAD-dependent oxidoreductase [Arachidicoccus sp.]|uniref:NAD(P)/FAD-dependent oxidoreductase n=1 Tax=Arachidicoccus sp. TaxID=1872624 RepID=UPI003D21BED1